MPSHTPTAALALPAHAIARPRARGGVGVPARHLRRLASTLGDIAEILAVAYAIPLVILGIGIPVALLVRLGMWIAGSL
ncbi:MAG TPA: hypothetical protein VK911_16195 [Vicinamibacterales bacterium]|nr:hypothetical protein [Vicinamibacterales bacterium]